MEDKIGFLARKKMYVNPYKYTKGRDTQEHEDEHRGIVKKQ